LHIRKHMVSLRGSRYGQRVAFQVERMRTTQKSSSSSVTTTNTSNNTWQHRARWD
jgi:hypothetical protein